MNVFHSLRLTFEISFGGSSCLIEYSWLFQKYYFDHFWIPELCYSLFIPPKKVRSQFVSVVQTILGEGGVRGILVEKKFPTQEWSGKQYSWRLRIKSVRYARIELIRQEA